MTQGLLKTKKHLYTGTITSPTYGGIIVLHETIHNDDF